MASLKTLSNEKGTPNAAPAFRQLATRMATELLTDWVGQERAGEAVGRIGTALSSAAASAKKPEDFYSCTPASIANCVAVAALTGIMPSSGAGALAYLIPRSPRRGEQKQLGFSFSHRGLNALAVRSGQIMLATPISTEDSISVTRDGEAEVEWIDFDNPPTEYDELRGVMVVVKRIDTGLVMTRGWMARKLIDIRRADSDSYQFATKPGNEWAQDSDPWHKWPIEMAMKTAMHYAVSRGWCVIDDSSSVRALSVDATNTIDAVSYRQHVSSAVVESESDPLDSSTVESAKNESLRNEGKSHSVESSEDDLDAEFREAQAAEQASTESHQKKEKDAKIATGSLTEPWIAKINKANTANGARAILTKSLITNASWNDADKKLLQDACSEAVKKFPQS